MPSSLRTGTDSGSRSLAGPARSGHPRARRWQAGGAACTPRLGLPARSRRPGGVVAADSDKAVAAESTPARVGEGGFNPAEPGLRVSRERSALARAARPGWVRSCGMGP